MGCGTNQEQDKPFEQSPVDSGSLLAGEIEQVWTIAWPVILTNLLNVSVGIIDFKMVGSLGVTPIAAVGVARQVLVAHAYGAGNHDQVSRVAGRAISLLLGTALLIITPAGLLFSKPMLVALGASDAVVQAGDTYLRILFAGCIFTMFNFTITGILLGVGRTKVSLMLLVVVNLLNIGFNYVFIFGVGPVPAYGVSGAAIGTVLSRAIGSLAGIWILATPRLPIQLAFRDCLQVDFHLFRKILHLGGPRSLQGIVRNFSRLMTIRIITLLPEPTRAISAYSVGMQVRMISTFVGLAFMAAATARVGQNMGAGKPHMAEKSAWIAAAMATALMSVVAVIFLLIPEMIMGFFTDNPDVISMGRTFFIIIALAEPVMAFAFAMSGGLRGGGDPVSPFIYSSVSDLVVVIAVGYLLAIPCGMGFAGVAVGLAVSAITRALPTMLKFRQGKWKHITLLDPTTVQES
jgi:putative MATE family efflux protein